VDSFLLAAPYTISLYPSARSTPLVGLWTRSLWLVAVITSQIDSLLLLSGYRLLESIDVLSHSHHLALIISDGKDKESEPTLIARMVSNMASCTPEAPVVSAPSLSVRLRLSVLDSGFSSGGGVGVSDLVITLRTSSLVLVRYWSIQQSYRRDEGD
jgi:hypothetical protein